MGKAYYSEATGKYVTTRFTVISYTDSSGDTAYRLYDEWEEVGQFDYYRTRAEANKEAKRMEKLTGALQPWLKCRR